MIEISRRVNNTIQMPIVTLEKGPTEIQLLGCIHIGNADYYTAAQNTLEQMYGDGYEVHFEGVDFKLSSLPDDTTILESIMAKRLREKKEKLQYTNAADALGLVTQDEYMTFHDTWKQADMHIVDVIRMVGFGVMCDFMNSCDVAIGEHERRELIKHFDNMVAADHSNKDESTSQDPFDVMHRQRDQIAAASALDAADNGADGIAMIWGSGHVRGISRILTQAGFQHTNTRWMDALTIHSV